MKMSMYVAVLDICKKHEVEWSEIPKIVSAVDGLQLSVNELNALALSHLESSVIVSSYKAQKLEELIASLIEVHVAFKALASVTNDPGLLLKHNFGSAKLKSMADGKLKVHIAHVAEDLIAAGNILEPYGLSNERIGEILQVIEETSIAISKPRTVIVERKSTTKSLSTKITAIDRLIREQLDNLVRLQKRNLPEFFDEYFNARLIIHTRGKKTGSSDPMINSTPAEPDDGV
jgi:hypothetical protein